MNFAICTIDGTEWRAEAFELLPRGTLNLYRNHLICKECRKKAFFTKSGTNGRGPSFGAKDHAGCNLATVDETNISEGTLKSRSIKINRTNEIEVDLNFGAHEYDHVKDIKEGDEEGRGRRGWRHELDDSPSVARSKRRLSTILNNLFTYPDYENSDLILKLPIIDRISAREVFKRWEALEIEPNRYYLFWGKISGYNEKQYNTFIKGGSIDIMLLTRTLNDLKNRYHLSKTSDLIGMKIICFAESKTTHIPVPSIEQLHVSK